MASAPRGRKPKNPADRKSKPIGMRFPSVLLEQLENARKISGRSLPNEVAWHLERSFEKDETITEAFGGLKTYAFLRLVSLALRGLRETTGHQWLDDRFTFNEALKVIADLIDKFKPAGSGAVPIDAPMAQVLIDNGLAKSNSEALGMVEKMTLGKSAAKNAWLHLLGTTLGRWDESSAMKKISADLRSVIERSPDYQTLRQGLAKLPPKSKRTRT